MTANERALQSINKELEKLNKSKERLEKALEKKTAEAEKQNINITEAEWFAMRDNTDITEKQYAAYIDLYGARRDLKDVLKRIEKVSRRKEDSETAVKTAYEKKTAEEIERQKAEEIAEWAKDGITVEDMSSNFVYGKTPKGKKFCIYGNNGMTERSRHCFTLTIDGETIFTSGEFYRAYRTVKNS